MLNFTVDRKSFKAMLAHAARVTERRNTIPILSYIRFDVGRDVVTFTATDLDMELSAVLPAATEGEGTILLPLDTLKATVGKFTGESVRVESIGNGKASLACVTSGARVILTTLPADDWPTIKPGDMLASMTLPVSAFAGAIASALPFVSTEETRYYLQGVYFHAVCETPAEPTEEHKAASAELGELKAIDATYREAYRKRVHMTREELDASEPLEPLSDEFKVQLETAKVAFDALERERCVPNVLRFAATDGHRLARVSYPLLALTADQKEAHAAAATMPDVIIPRKACKVLGAIVGKKPDRTDIRVAVNGAKIQIRYGYFTLLTKVIDGAFPDYTRVIPTDGTVTLTVPAAEFAVAVESVAAVASEKTRAVALSVSESEGVILTCTSPENGRAAAIFEGATISEGAEQAIGFNAGYLTEILAAFPGDVTFAISDAAGPVRISSPDRSELLVVLMPMRVDAVVTTRADVEALHMNPWAKLQRQSAALAESIRALKAADLGGLGLKVVATKHIQPAIAFLVEQGEARYVARQRVKCELAFAAGDQAAGDHALRLIDAYTGGALGEGFAGLSIWGPGGTVAQAVTAYETAKAEGEEADDAGPVQDPAPQDPGPPLDPAPDDVPDFVIPDEEIVPTGSTFDSPPPETVAAVAADIPAEGTRTPVKVETVYGQVIFVDAGDYADETKERIRRLHKSGDPFIERESKGGNWQKVLRANIARAILPRVRGDVPHPAAKATVAPQADVTARLAALERMVAGLAGLPVAAPPRRSEAHLRALRAYLALRRARARIASLEAAHATACRNTLDDRSARGIAEGERDAALERAAMLQIRCDALERLQLDSGPLDTAAAAVNGKPAIILPVSRTSARAQ